MRDFCTFKSPEIVMRISVRKASWQFRKSNLLQVSQAHMSGLFHDYRLTARGLPRAVHH